METGMSLFAASRSESQEAFARILCSYMSKSCGVNGAGNISEVFRELIKKKKLCFIEMLFAYGMTFSCLKFDPLIEAINAKASDVFHSFVSLATHDQLNLATVTILAVKKWTDENLFMLASIMGEIKKRTVMMSTYARDVCSFDEWIGESMLVAKEEKNYAARDFLKFQIKRGAMFSPSKPLLAGVYNERRLGSYFVAGAERGEPKAQQPRGPGRKLRIQRRKEKQAKEKRGK